MEDGASRLVELARDLARGVGDPEAAFAAVVDGALWLREHGEHQWTRSVLYAGVKPLGGGAGSRLPLRSRVLRAGPLEAAGGNGDGTQDPERFLAMLSASDRPGARVLLAGALIERASLLQRSGDLSGTMAAVDDLLSRFAGDPDPEIRSFVAEAHNDRAWLLGRFSDQGGTLAEFSTVVEGFRDDELAKTRSHVATALEGVAVCESNQGETERAAAAYEDLLAYVEGWPSSSAQQQRLKAVRGMIVIAFGQGLMGEVTRLAEQLEILIRAGSVVRDEGTETLLETANSLRTLDEFDRALAVLDDVVALLAASADPLERGRVGLALQLKADLLEEAGRDEEASVVRSGGLENYQSELLKLFDRMIEEPGSRAGDPDGTRRLLGALFAKAEMLTELGMTSDARDVLTRLAEVCDSSGELGDELRTAARDRWPDLFAG